MKELATIITFLGLILVGFLFLSELFKTIKVPYKVPRIFLFLIFTGIGISFMLLAFSEPSIISSLWFKPALRLSQLTGGFVMVYSFIQYAKTGESASGLVSMVLAFLEISSLYLF